MSGKRQVFLLFVSALLLVSCFPEMTQTTSGMRVPKLTEYNLDPNHFDYRNDEIDVGAIYMLPMDENEQDFLSTAFVFNESGAFKEIGVDSKSPTAAEVDKAPIYRYGLYGVNDTEVILEAYSRPDGFYREIAEIRGDSLCLMGLDYGKLSSFQKYDQEECRVRTPVDFLEQIPFVYPGQFMLE
jgi:hypothetical protein